MSLSGSERSSRSERPRTRRKLFRKRDKRSHSSERYDFSDLEDEIFVRGPRKLRREDVEGELSYDYSRPGQLKVFTAGLSQRGGLPEFKTVLVSATTTAADVIASVLEHCEILYDDEDEFYLCEVIGQLEPYHASNFGANRSVGHFVEQCRRIIGPGEHVLVIHALWKPLHGCFRRFELKQHSRKDDGGYRRPTRLRCNGDNGVSAGFSDFFHAYDLDIDNELKVTQRRVSKSCSTQVEPVDQRWRRAAATQTESVYFATADRHSRRSQSAPLGPYLLLLKGFDSRHDRLVNELYETNILGSDDSRCDIQLRCADVQAEHCVIEACQSDTDGSRPYHMTLAPIGQSEVLLNGQLLCGRRRIVPGDVVSVGAGEMRSYAFVFKDSSQQPDRTVPLNWLDLLEGVQGGRDGGFQLRDLGRLTQSALSFGSTTPPSDSVLGSPEPNDEAGSSATQDAVQAVLLLYFSEAIDVTCAAALILMLIVYAEQLQLHRAVADVQWQLSDAALALTKKSQQAESQSQKLESCTEMMRASCLLLELLLVLQSEQLNPLLQQQEACLQWRSYCESVMQQLLDSVFELIAEEISQLSPALFDFGHADRPINNGSCNNGVNASSMDSLITLITQLNQSLIYKQLHHQQQQQQQQQQHSVMMLRDVIMKRLMFLLSKLFMLQLLSKDSTDDLRWNRAVQLRINIDQLEECLRFESLSQLLPAMALPNSAVDLLATPRAQLVTMSWPMLRSTFPNLPSPALRHLLLHYDSGSGPNDSLWLPPAAEAAEADYKLSCSIEDYYAQAEHDLELTSGRPSTAPIDLGQLLADSEFKELILHLDQQLESDHELQWRKIGRHVQRHLAEPHAGGDARTSFASDNVDKCEEHPDSGGPTPGRRAKPKRPQTPTPENPTGATGGELEAQQAAGSFGHVEEQISDVEELMDENTMANTIRNEIHAHYVLSDEEEIMDEEKDGVQHEVNGFKDHLDELPDAAERQLLSGLCPDLWEHNSASECSSSRPQARMSFCSDWQLPGSIQQKQATPLTKQSTQSSLTAPAAPPRTASLGSRRSATAFSECVSDFTDSDSIGASASLLGGNGDAEESSDDGDDMFFVTIERRPGESFGLELVDGTKTDLSSAGVYVRHVRRHSPAAACQRLRPGCRIIAVNNNSLVNVPYSQSLSLIKESKRLLQLLVAKGDRSVAMRVQASAC